MDDGLNALETVLIGPYNRVPHDDIRGDCCHGDNLKE